MVEGRSISMKHGKKPTREQRKLIEMWGFKASDWLVVKNTLEEIVLVHRTEEKLMKLPKTQGRYL